MGISYGQNTTLPDYVCQRDNSDLYSVRDDHAAPVLTEVDDRRRMAEYQDQLRALDKAGHGVRAISVLAVLDKAGWVLVPRDRLSLTDARVGGVQVIHTTLKTYDGEYPVEITMTPKATPPQDSGAAVSIHGTIQERPDGDTVTAFVPKGYKLVVVKADDKEKGPHD